MNKGPDGEMLRSEVVDSWGGVLVCNEILEVTSINAKSESQTTIS